MTDYTPIDPEHYKKTPPGIGLECIDYIELLPHSQATAGKYLYRGGNKDELAQELGKTLWYVRRARSKKLIADLRQIDNSKVETIDPSVSLRSLLFLLTVTGNLDLVEYMVESIIKDGVELD